MATTSEMSETYPSAAAYVAARDNEFELLENPSLQAGAANSGAIGDCVWLKGRKNSYADAGRWSQMHADFSFPG